MKFIFVEYMHYCGLCNNYVCILKMYENIHLVQYKFKVVSRDRVLKPVKTSSFLENLKLLDKFVQVLGIPSSKLPVVGIWVLTNPKFQRPKISPLSLSNILNVHQTTFGDLPQHTYSNGFLHRISRNFTENIKELCTEYQGICVSFKSLKLHIYV